LTDLWLIIVLVFAAASLAIYAVYWIFVLNRHAQKTLNRRLMLRQHLDSSATLETLRRERGFLGDSDAHPLLRRASDWLTQTGIEVQLKSLGLIFAAIFLALVFVFSRLLGIGIVAILLAALVGVGGVFFYLSSKRRKRIRAFTEQLPDAIDVIVRGVRVGLPLVSAVSLVAREMADPIGTEFGMFGDEIAFGLDLRKALDNLSRRVGQEDLLFLTISIGVQSQTGGSLGEILSRLSRLMRRRSAMQLKVRALSAEGRLSGVFLSLFPLLLTLLINLLSPRYYDAIRGSHLFEPAIIVAVLMLAVGNIAMFRMINFKY
jgi:tight adherence protein B